MARKSPSDIPNPPEVELQRLAPLHEAARLAGCSIRFLRDHHRDKIVVIGPRMHRMRVGHALNIADSSKQPAVQVTPPRLRQAESETANA